MLVADGQTWSRQRGEQKPSVKIAESEYFAPAPQVSKARTKKELLYSSSRSCDAGPVVGRGGAVSRGCSR
jgi:hypothetical protein